MAGAAVLLCAAMMPARPMLVMGQSMEPTLHSGQMAVLDTRYYQQHPVRTGDVIAFNRDGQVYVKRVLATAGDSLVMLHYIRGNRRDLVLNWQLSHFERLSRNYFPHNFDGKLVNCRVPEGTCFVVGDNANASEDSRTFGPVALEEIRGKALSAGPAPEWVSQVVHARVRTTYRHDGLPARPDIAPSRG